MKIIFSILILIAGWHYATTGLKNMQTGGSQATSMNRAVSDQVATITDQVKDSLKGISNPFQGTSVAVASEGKPETMLNVVTAIHTPRDCSGMDCYPDLEPVITASN